MEQTNPRGSRSSRGAVPNPGNPLTMGTSVLRTLIALDLRWLLGGWLLGGVAGRGGGPPAARPAAPCANRQRPPGTSRSQWSRWVDQAAGGQGGGGRPQGGSGSPACPRGGGRGLHAATIALIHPRAPGEQPRSYHGSSGLVPRWVGEDTSRSRTGAEVGLAGCCWAAAANCGHSGG